MVNRAFYKDPVFLGWAVPTVLAAGVYLLTMCRTVYVGDSGEFTLVLKTLGIAHPPGYPLFTIAGHVFVTILSFLKPALAANLFGVLAAAAAIPALFFLVGGRRDPLLCGALCLLWAFSPAYWEESNAIEVYAFSLVLVATISALALSDNHRKWYIIAYLLGLSLAHHLSALAVIPAAGYVFLTEKNRDRWKPFPIYLLLLILGLTINLYLPIRSSVAPLVDWGHPAEWKLFINHITAAQYQKGVAFSLSNLTESLKLFATILLRNWGWMGLGLMAWGWIYGQKTYLQRTIFASILLGSNLCLSAFYRIEDIDSYFLPGLLACWLLLSQGVLGLWERFPKAHSALLTGIVLAAPLLLILNYRDLDQSRNHLAEDYGKLILDTAGEGTVFTNEDNSSFTSLYMRYAEDYRPRVAVYDGAMRAPALMKAATQLSGQPVNDFYDALRIYLKQAPGDKYIDGPELAPEVTSIKPYGVLYALQPPRRLEPPIPELWTGAPPGDFRARGILVRLEAATAMWWLRQVPPDSSSAKRHISRALALYEHEPRGSLHNQLGLGLRQCGAEEEALTCFHRALEAPRLDADLRKEVVLNLSNLYKDRGYRLAQCEDYSGSVEAFKKTLEYDPGNDEAMYSVGLIYTKYLKQFDPALPYLEKYLQNHPSDQNVANLVSLIKRR